MARTFLQISCFLGFLAFFQVASALWFSFDTACTAYKVNLVRENCSNATALYSKCSTYNYETYICWLWWWWNKGPIHSVSAPILYSHANSRTPIPTEIYNKKIYRYGLEHEVISYAWDHWKDLDFILMVQEESLWEEFIFWDNGNSIGYCQINKLYGKELYEEYLRAKDWKERITLCYNHYKKFEWNVWIVFHAWNTRMRNLPSFTFR